MFTDLPGIPPHENVAEWFSLLGSARLPQLVTDGLLCVVFFGFSLAPAPDVCQGAVSRHDSAKRRVDLTISSPFPLPKETQRKLAFEYHLCRLDV